MEYTFAVTFAVCTLFVSTVAAASDCKEELGTTLFPLVVIDDGGDQCPTSGNAEVVADISHNVSIVLQDVISRKLPGITAECPATSCVEIAEKLPDGPSGYYYVLNSTSLATQVFCEMDDALPDSLNTTKGWVRVANLDLRDPDEECPNGFSLHTDPVRVCRKPTDGGCDSIVYSTYGIPYRHVCGRVSGYQYGSPDAFDRSYGACQNLCTNIDQPYVEGVSITYGNPRQHIWTYAAGHLETSNHLSSCPCTGVGIAPPDFVGSDYYCESANSDPQWDRVVYSSDPLWDGQDCDGDEGTCCDPPNLPWFCKELPQPTTDDVEVRVCIDQVMIDENVLINLLELYIQ